MVPSNPQASGAAKSHCAKTCTAQPVVNKIKLLRLVVNQKVLAGRNQAVAPVGAWVENARSQWEESLERQAFVSAFHVEAELKKQQKEKQEHLRRFQGEVRHRVNQWAKLQEKKQLLKSYETAEQEGLVVRQTLDAAKHMTPKRDTCMYRSSREPTIYSFGSRSVCAQPLGDSVEEDAGEEEGEEGGSELFQHQAKILNKTMKHVRHRLAACKTIQEREALTDLPGGIWKVSPTRDNPASRRHSQVHMKDDEEEFFLEGYHDLPADLQHQMQICSRVGNNAMAQEELGKGSSSKRPEPQRSESWSESTSSSSCGTNRKDQAVEDNRKWNHLRQNQYVMYRRLFMDIEREQVQQQRRQKEHEKRIAKIKNEKEKQRRTEEQKIQGLVTQQDLYPRDTKHEILTQLQLEEESRRVNKEKKQRNKENVRYIEALRAQMREKIKLYNIELPLLCCCGTDFWDSHPDTCANNCLFYRNPKAYTQALQSVISSCDMWNKNTVPRNLAQTIASAHGQPPKSP
ncbi:coiled-coil domain-containing protein 15 isoform X2 [Rhinatrema bivittatum]|uniref:coiled-coil domain-containing protein 15 isoform X2 n=1 Tax=Rhinatrema bivittatum TaxID=194408 RepID=UPI00112EDA70|nr:coiled-coil domain-containing protein 15 isoform X2 [Rhinatrema bivittatum]